MTDLAKLVVSLEAQSAKYLTQLEKSRKETDKWRGKVNKNVSDVARTFRGLAGAAAIGLFVRSVVNATKQQEAALAQLQAGWESTGGVVGKTVDEIAAKAAEFQKQSIFGDEAIIEAQSQLLTFTNVTEETFDRATQAALDLSTRMGTDLKSSIVQIGKVLNEPVGQLSQLARSGIQFSDSQEAMIKTLAESGRLVEAQAVILGELETQFGGSAKAARETFGGAISGLSNAFGDLLESEGGLNDSRLAIEDLTSLLQDPAFKESANAITAGIITAFSGMAKVITGTVDVVRWAAEEMAALINGPNDAVRINDKINAIDNLLQNRRYLTDARREELNQERQLLVEKLEILEQIAAREQSAAPSLDLSGAVPASSGLDISDISADGETTLEEMQAEVQSARVEMLLQQQQAAADALSGLEDQMLSEESRIRQSYENRLAIVQDALNQQLISEERAAEIRANVQADHDNWETNQALKKYSVLLEVADGYFSGMSGSQSAYARLAIGLGEALLDSEKRNAIKSIGINTWDAAMSAYNSLAGIPIIGPALGLTAATAIGVTGAAYAANVAGIAHGGLDYVPSESTYLLDAGERVVSPNQNADLTGFLKDQKSGESSPVIGSVVMSFPGVTNSAEAKKSAAQAARELKSMVSGSGRY